MLPLLDVITELAQVGTQFDMFSHQAIGNQLYNCFDNDEIATRNGVTKLGVEKIGIAWPSWCARAR